ncbi:BPL-N domain-containing protein [Vibrio sp. SCSIO 43137]|uniref:BPL-N domain-containing protein n=1 Tax=Vibrio sp. SCSIO 43137 TaxID=3021011 RepID=UPI00230716A7|nr:BPL-N domain-containing protein [Vibrio sp. SCSIO 43137]WCE28868.1 BPL-N domain-containing protein [Vibrio sp. SCSIO 43137]
MNILIYSDNVSANHILYYALGRLRGKKGIYFVNSAEILDGALTADIDLFVMPGGASRYKAAKLNGKANQLIKQYVANGGRYLGICAGAYMACEQTEWAKGQAHEIITENELAFFPGIAQGPVETFGKGDNYNCTRPRLVALDINGQQSRSLYIGGCTFHASVNSGYQVLARYSEVADKPAAIVSGNHGDGKWLLCSTHPEYDQQALELMAFDVVGNDYEDFAQIPADSELDLSLLDSLLNHLQA